MGAAEKRTLWDSNIDPRNAKWFFGREDLLATMLERLKDVRENPSFLVLQGHPGCGKSELAQEFARRNLSLYPGGTYLVSEPTSDPPKDLWYSVGKVHLKLFSDNDTTDYGFMAESALHKLGELPSLLIYDNVLKAEQINKWRPRSGRRCQVIVTTLSESWNPALGWPEPIRVPGLSRAESLKLVRYFTTDENTLERLVPDSYLEHLVDAADGLPVQLCTGAALLRARHDRLDSVRMSATVGTRVCFAKAYKLLGSKAKLLLRAAAAFDSQRIPLEEVRSNTAEAPGFDGEHFDKARADCSELGLLKLRQTGESLWMHQLWAGYVRDLPAGPKGSTTLDRIRHHQRERILQLCEEVRAKPADLDLARLLTGYALAPEVWTQLGLEITAFSAETVGEALTAIGKFEEARPWHEVAVREKLQSGPDGAVDHESVGESANQAGWCFSQQGDFKEALRWYVRAVAHKRRGASGVVNHASLGKSMNQVGWCLFKRGCYPKARRWFEYAVSKKELGGPDGVDHTEVGTSHHLIGMSLSQQRLWLDAMPSYERAVLEKKLGDANGRIDYRSVGTSMNQVGWCLTHLGLFEAARDRYIPASILHRKGDIHGRVDNESLSQSLHGVARFLLETRRWGAARTWFALAVAATEKGDLRGRVDHISLGSSILYVALCLTIMGQFGEALDLHLKARDEMERGNAWGEPNHTRLGECLHQIGLFHLLVAACDKAGPWLNRSPGQTQTSELPSLTSSLREVAAAGETECPAPRLWFERAAKEKEKGDMHGRIDSFSLSESRYQVGLCLMGEGKSEEAQVWFKLAAEARNPSQR